MLGQAEPRLPDPRIEAEVADQLLRSREATDVADRGDQPRGDREIHPGDREQTPYRRIVDGGFCDLAIEHGEVLAEPVELAQMPGDRCTLIIGKTCRASQSRP